MTIKIILFDFFGVISTPPFTPTIKKFISEDQQSTFISKLDKLDLGYLSEQDLVIQIAQNATVSQEVIWQTLNQSIKIDHDLLKFINLEIRKYFKVGLLSNAPRSLLERILENELLKFNPLLISSDLKLIKPDFEIFKYAIDICNCAPNQILFIDDRIQNVEAAKKVGMLSIVYKDFIQLKNELRNIL